MRYLFQAILCFQLSYNANKLNKTSTCIGKIKKKKNNFKTPIKTKI